MQKSLGGKQHFLENDKIPFRIKLTEDKKILNVNKFVLQHPKVRNYIFECYFMKLTNMKVDYLYTMISWK